MTTLTQKLSISAFSTLLYLFVNSPYSYEWTDKIFYGTYTKKGCPTKKGIIIHTALFFILTLLSMGNIYKKTSFKLRNAIYGTLIFFFVASPAMFYLTSYLLGKGVTTKDGCPTHLGTFIHAVVYCATLVGVMYLPE